MILTTPVSLFYRISTYNFILSILLYTFPKMFSPYIQEIIRALSLLIGSAVFYVYIVYGFNKIIELYSNFIPANLPFIVYYLLDYMLHFLPILLNGFPKTLNGLLVAYSIIIAWYILARKYMNILYFENMSQKEYDFIIFIYLILIVIIYKLFI